MLCVGSMRSLVSVVACITSFVRANPSLVADLQTASNAAGEACGASLEGGVVVAGETDGASLAVAGVACAGEYAAAAAGALLSWSTSVMIMWATSTTTPPACGSSFDLPAGQTCFNFPAKSACYQQCCQVQQTWCDSNEHDNYNQCLRDRACMFPGVREFSAVQLMFLHSDMDELNDHYNGMVHALSAINITQTIQSGQWGDLTLACNNMLSRGQDFMDKITDAQKDVNCDDPLALCSVFAAADDFDLSTGTCFNFLGPCYNQCCEKQAQYCEDDVQCKHDRGCRQTPDTDTLQAEVCQHLDSCRTSMRLARQDITNLHDCTMQMRDGGCSASAVRHQLAMVTSQLNNTHAELQALESLAVGHGTHSLETIHGPPEPLLLTSSADLEEYWERARAAPFKVVFEHLGDTTPAPAITGDGHAPTTPMLLILGSSLWIAFFLHLGKSKSSSAVAHSRTIDGNESLRKPFLSGSTSQAQPLPQSGANEVDLGKLTRLVNECEGLMRSEDESKGSKLELKLQEIKQAVSQWHQADEEEGHANGQAQSPSARQREQKQTGGFLWPWGPAMLGPAIAIFVLYHNAPASAPSPMQQMMSPEVDSDTLSTLYWDHLSSSMHPIITQLSSLEQSSCTCSRMLAAPLSEDVAVLFQYLTEVPH